MIILPTVMIGGVSILALLIGTPECIRNSIRQDLWRAGHAHAGVFLPLTFIALSYVDEASLSERSKWFMRLSTLSVAILLPVVFFFFIITLDATEPNQVIYLVYIGAAVLAAGVLVLGAGLLKRSSIRAYEKIFL